jgi:hypothetical protein
LEIDFFELIIFSYCLILQIAVGDILCEIETDKATLEFESLEEGYFFYSFYFFLPKFWMAFNLKLEVKG